MSQLTLGDVNVLVITDDHSWVGGHAQHEPQLDMDYGTVLSFYLKLHETLSSQGRDLFLVMNGDFMDGTGITTHPPAHLVDILERLPFDAANIGNHELYRNDTVEFMTGPGGLVETLAGRYLTSNVILSSTHEPIGNRFRFLYGQQSGYSTLTFGFIYNFVGHCANTIVEYVQDVVESEWFINVLSGKEGHFDAILVLAHMHVTDPLVFTIHQAIRSVVGEYMPIQFITGHTHIRAFSTIDSYSTTFEAGRYLDTLGFVSFPTQSSILKDKSSLFYHDFLNGSTLSLKQVVETTDLDTPSGQALSQYISNLRKSMGLDDIVGCSLKTYVLNNPLNQDDSLWALFLNHIVPTQLFHGQPKGKLYIQNTGAFRYNLFKGFVTVDDLISVSPYNDAIFLLDGKVYGQDFIQAFSEYVGPEKISTLSLFVVAGNVDPNEFYDVYVPMFDLPYILSAIGNVTGSNIQAVAVNNTTTGTLFSDYVSSQWKCNYSDSVEKNLLFISLSLLLTFSVFILCRRRRHGRTQYSELDRGTIQKRPVNDTVVDGITGGEML